MPSTWYGAKAGRFPRSVSIPHIEVRQSPLQCGEGILSAARCAARGVAIQTLVTGGAGFIGSTLVDALLAAGHHVAVVDDLSTGSLENLEGATTYGSAFSFINLDIRDDALAGVMASQKPEVVIHLAAQISVAASVEDPTADAEINILGTLRVLAAAHAAGARKLLFATSAAIYGDVAESDLPIRESQPHQPLSPYGISKAVALSYLTATREHYGVEWSALALANVYGPRQSAVGEAGVVARFADHLHRGERPTIFGDGEQQRDFLFVGDAVDAFLLAMSGADGLVLNIGTGRGVSVNELWRYLADAAQSDLTPIYGPRREGDLQASRLDSSLANATLGWSAKTSLQEGLGQIVGPNP
jgi:UDP-glucose 4-epimerase